MYGKCAHFANNLFVSPVKNSPSRFDKRHLGMYAPCSIICILSFSIKMIPVMFHPSRCAKTTSGRPPAPTGVSPSERSSVAGSARGQELLIFCAVQDVMSQNPDVLGEPQNS